MNDSRTKIMQPEFMFVSLWRQALRRLQKICTWS